jgi:hypothetical protein
MIDDCPVLLKRNPTPEFYVTPVDDYLSVRRWSRWRWGRNKPTTGAGTMQVTSWSVGRFLMPLACPSPFSSAHIAYHLCVKRKGEAGSPALYYTIESP